MVVKCSEILAHIELPFNPRVNKVFTSHFTSLHFTDFGSLSFAVNLPIY